MDELLSERELEVVDLLAEATRRFWALPEHHPADVDEWLAPMHQLQRQVMARAARRAYPERFAQMTA